MMAGTFRGRMIVVPRRRNVMSHATALAISLAAIFARLSRYGVIRFDRASTVTDKNHNPTWTGPPYGRTARSRVAPVASAFFRQRMLPEDVGHFEPCLSLSFHG